MTRILFFFGLVLGWLAILFGCWWTPKPPVQTVHEYREVDVSQLHSKRSEPGKLSPETLQQKRVDAAVEVFKDPNFRDPTRRKNEASSTQ